MWCFLLKLCLALQFCRLLTLAIIEPETFYATTAPDIPDLLSAQLFSSASGEFLLIGGLSTYTSSDYGRTWSQAEAAPGGYFAAVTGNSTGQLIAVLSNEGIMLSTDYGQTWTPPEDEPDAVYSGLAASSTGQHMVAVSNGGGIWVSSTYGNTWNTTYYYFDIWWYDVAISGSGRYMLASQSDGFVYLSTDYGVSWAAVQGLAENCYDYLTIDATGQYMTATVCEARNGVPSMWTSKDFGETWTTTPTGYWTQVAASGETGQYVLAASANSLSDEDLNVAQVWVSSDYGESFSLVLEGPSLISRSSYTYTALAVSETGQYMVAGTSGYAWVSYSGDFGQTWSAADDNNTWWARYEVAALTLNSAGDTVFAAVPGVGIFQSINYGKNWTVVFTNTSNWAAIAYSRDGSMIATGISTDASNSDLGQIWLSKDGGITWIVSTAPYGSWVSLASDASGAFIVAANAGYVDKPSSTIWLSTDAGVTWSLSESAPKGQSWVSVVCDSEGKSLYASGYYGLYNSSDYGQTWQLQDPANYGSFTYYYGGITMNNNATLIVAGSTSYLQRYTPESGWQTGLQGAVVSVAQAVNAPQRLIASTNLGLFVSDSYGALWSTTQFSPKPTYSSWQSVATDAMGTGMIVSNLDTAAIYTTNQSVTLLGPTLTPTLSPSADPGESGSDSKHKVSDAVIYGSAVGAGAAVWIIGNVVYYGFIKKASAANAGMIEPLAAGQKSSQV
jgi:hypothetical protein